MEQRITLRAVMFKSGNLWVGQCLEHDIAAQAKEPKDLAYQLERAIVGHIVIAQDNGIEPFKTVAPAPERYWKMFERGLKVEVPEDHVFTVGGVSPVPMREIRLSEPILEPA